MERSFQMCLVSDSAGKEQSMAFGWLIQDDNNMILVECTGPAFGSCQSSFCAEVYGMLSGVWFIYHVFAFTNSPIDWIIEASADNAGLIKQEMRFEKQVAVTIQIMEQQPKLFHVQDHQDNVTLRKNNGEAR
eukprot:9237521-Ditylum_brightwellii.AAC.1